MSSMGTYLGNNNDNRRETKMDKADGSDDETEWGNGG